MQLKSLWCMCGPDERRDAPEQPRSIDFCPSLLDKPWTDHIINELTDFRNIIVLNKFIIIKRTAALLCAVFMLAPAAHAWEELCVDVADDRRLGAVYFQIFHGFDEFPYFGRQQFHLSLKFLSGRVSWQEREQYGHDKIDRWRARGINHFDWMSRGERRCADITHIRLGENIAVFAGVGGDYGHTKYGGLVRLFCYTKWDRAGTAQERYVYAQRHRGGLYAPRLVYQVRGGRYPDPPECQFIREEPR